MSVSGGTMPFSAAETKEIRSIQFGLLDPDKIRQLSVVKIDQIRIMDDFGNPYPCGINDIRMGTVDKTKVCGTCGCNFEHCPGHFGHIELALPVYHTGYFDEIKKILRCVCFYCGKILLKKCEPKYEMIMKVRDPKRRQKMFYDACKTLTECKNGSNRKGSSGMETDEATMDNEQEHLYDGCGKKQPIYTKVDDDPLRIDIEYQDIDGDPDFKKTNILYAEKTLEIFKKISDEDCEALGFNYKFARPEWMIIKNLAVCPPQVRPSVAVDASLRSEDDLTYQYSQIIKVNKELEKQLNKGAGETLVEKLRKSLQYYISTLMNNEMSGVNAQQRSGKPIKSIATRLKGKEGRLRGNLMGKRVDFSARSVISPDPNLLLDELGVPQSVAMNLTFPEAVTDMNIDYMKQLVLNGPRKWPGAKMIIREDGVKIDLRHASNLTDIHLEKGYIVERHIQNGEFVVFNRQPSLHKMSMMCHRARILPYSTFRLNLSVTTPYNADFDGDEMNMHVPQSYETKAEISNILYVPKQIVSPQSNKPVMGIVQDALIGVMIFTLRDTFITYEQVMNLVMWIIDWNGELPTPAILKPKPLWTGKQIFSLILPKLTLIRYTNGHDDKKNGPSNINDTEVRIEEGELLTGIVCKRTVGNTSGGLIHCIWNEFGHQQALLFLSNCQRLINNYLLIAGWTIGISDMVTDKGTIDGVKQIMDNMKKEVKQKLSEAQNGKLPSQPGKSMLETFEYNANLCLNGATGKAGKLVQSTMKRRNHLRNMVIAGSKGNPTNISQIMACVGQQNVEGKRIAFNFMGRTLPHFVKDDYGAESKGFVRNSYLQGLSPQEFYFHSMGGREGVIDTAVKTSVTGYIQRRLVKALEDITISYDGTVRNSVGSLIQMFYGEDGMNGELIEDQKIETLNMTDEQLESHFKFFEGDATKNFNISKISEKMKAFMENDLVENLVHSDQLNQMIVDLENEYKQIKADRDLMRFHIFVDTDEKQHLAVNIPRIIFNAKAKFKMSIYSKSDLSPIKVLKEVQKLINDLVLVKGEDRMAKEAQSSVLTLISIMLRYNLSCKRIIEQERFSENAFEYLIGEIKSRFFQTIVVPGEMVGNIAAQSIGEPATQMTLNTFHFAGDSSQNVTLGVPRLTEIINVAKRLKTPSMTLYLNRNLPKEELSEKHTIIHSELEHVKLMDIVEVSEIYYDPDLRNSIIPEDQGMVDSMLEYMEENSADKVISPWVLRVKLDKEKTVGARLYMGDIEEKIKEFSEEILISRSDGNDVEYIIRIRLVFKEGKKDVSASDTCSVQALKLYEKELFTKLTLSGIPNIKKIYAFDDKGQYYEENGKLHIKKGEWAFNTDGTNMREMLQQNSLDFRKIRTNDINETAEVLGIEAVRTAIIEEIRLVLKPYAIYVNYRHICLLADIMTNRGFLTSITRHGLGKTEAGPIRRCSFEQTVDTLLEAAVFSEKDKLVGISENILVGKLAPLGTGSFDLLLDLDALEKANIPEQEQEQIIHQYPEHQQQYGPQFTPYNQSTPLPNSNTQHLNMTPTYMNGMFTPNISAQSPAYLTNLNSGNYITTPAPGSQRVTSPVYNPRNDTYKTPNVMSPAYNPQNSDYNNPAFSPKLSPSGSSMYNSRGYIQTTSPMGYSPTATPALMRSSASPAGYVGSSANYSSTPKMQESGGAASQYSPMSPSYNPISPSYNIQSAYSKSSSPNYINNSINNNSISNENNDDNNKRDLIIKKEDDKDDDNDK